MFSRIQAFIWQNLAKKDELGNYLIAPSSKIKTSLSQIKSPFQAQIRQP